MQVRSTGGGIVICLPRMVPGGCCWILGMGHIEGPIGLSTGAIPWDVHVKLGHGIDELLCRKVNTYSSLRLGAMWDIANLCGAK